MAPWKIGKKITVTCEDGYKVSPPTPADAGGFRAECVPGDPVWKYTSLDNGTEYASTPKCSNMKFCPVCTGMVKIMGPRLRDLTTDM